MDRCVIIQYTGYIIIIVANVAYNGNSGAYSDKPCAKKWSAWKPYMVDSCV